jgi:aspartate/methionine/tyrosine aminotransferase
MYDFAILTSMSRLAVSIQTALQKSPHEPFPEEPLLQVTNQILDKLKQLQAIYPEWDGYAKLQQSIKDILSPAEKKNLDRYLGITAFMMTRHMLEFSDVTFEQARQSMENSLITVVNTLAKELIKNPTKSLEYIEENTLNRIQGTSPASKKTVQKINDQQVKTNKKQSLVENLEMERDIIKQKVNEAKKQLSNGDGGSVIRFMMGVFNEINTVCLSKGIQPHLKNLTLGDVSGKNMPSGVVDQLGYDPMGPRGLSISSRADAYEAMLYEAGVQFDPHRYDLASLGWYGLRERFIEYGTHFGLYPERDHKESMIGEGGAGTLLRVFTAIHMYLKKNEPNKKFSAYFPNPAFRMVGDAAADAGLHVVEVATKPANGFFPDPKEVDEFFSHHSECKVFIFIPIGNPNATFPHISRVKEILEVLKKHDVILVNDFAYLGTGDKNKNKELAQVLSSYKKRIDSFSMSKIFGRTGLRCGCAVTTDDSLAQYFSPAAKHIQLGLSYPMEQEAMALWDLVTQKERNILNAYYRTQQQNLMEILKKNDLKRTKRGDKPLLDSHKPFFDQAGLYLYVPLTQGLDAFDVLQDTGLMGVSDGAFSNSSLSVEGPYVRFALGIERI